MLKNSEHFSHDDQRNIFISPFISHFMQNEVTSSIRSRTIYKTCFMGEISSPNQHCYAQNKDLQQLVHSVEMKYVYIEAFQLEASQRHFHLPQPHYHKMTESSMVSTRIIIPSSSMIDFVQKTLIWWFSRSLEVVNLLP